MDKSIDRRTETHNTFTDIAGSYKVAQKQGQMKAKGMDKQKNVCE